LAPITVAVSISVTAESTTPLWLPVLRSLRAGDRIMLIGYMIPLRPYAFRQRSLRFSDHRPGVLFTKLPSSHGLGPTTKPAQQPVPTASAGFRRRVGAPRVWFPLAHKAPFARVSLDSTPGPNAFRIWLPFKAPHADVTVAVRSECLASIFQPAALMGFSSFSGLFPPDSRTLRHPQIRALLSLSDFRGVPLVRWWYLSPASLNDLDVSRAYAVYHRAESFALRPVPAIVLDRLQGFGPSRRSLASPRGIPPSDG
jgi:hypothetical protein